MTEENEDDFDNNLPAIEESLTPAWRIYEAPWHEGLSREFDAVTIKIDGRLESALEWQEACQFAEQARDAEFKILWHIDLGLFDNLSKPLADESQFLSLSLSLQHFLEDLWPKFEDQTIGVSLYQGEADFSRKFPWDDVQKEHLKEWLLQNNENAFASYDFSSLLRDDEGRHFVRLFCRDVAFEYFTFLANRLPSNLPVYLYLDFSSLSLSPTTQLCFLNPQLVNRFQLCVKKCLFNHQAIGWKTPSSFGYVGLTEQALPAKQTPLVGICVPPASMYSSHFFKEIADALLTMEKTGRAYRLIAEEHLTSQWDGLDYILYAPGSLTEQGKRKLRGFCAAGGTLISTGHLMGFPHEVAFSVL